MHKPAATRTLPYWRTEGNIGLTSTIESRHKAERENTEPPRVLHTPASLHPLKEPSQRRDKCGLRQEYQTAINKAGREGIFPRKHKEMKSRER